MKKREFRTFFIYNLFVVFGLVSIYGVASAFIPPNLPPPPTIPTAEPTNTIGVSRGGTGLTSAGALNNVLTSNGTTWVSSTPVAGGVGGGGTINYISKFTASGTIGNSQIFDDGTNVGIGTSTPAQKLDVVGNINIDGSSAYLYDGNSALKLSKNGEANYHSTLVGSEAGNSGSASSTKQTAIGYGAGYQNTGISQTAIGYGAGYQNTGSSQIVIGYLAGYLNTGVRQTAVGYAAGQSNTGAYQTALGSFAGYQNIGASQTAFGFDAGRQNSGASQTALGFYAGRENTGNQVTGIGIEAGYLNTANDVVAIGYQAGKSNAVANQFIVKQTNINAVPLIQGDFATGNVGIGTTSPTAKLHLPAAQAGANLASLKIPSGVVATTPVAGNIEADNDHIYWTKADGTRLQLDN